MSDPPPKKVGSLKDRLAMFENKGATPAPGPPPAPRPKPGNISWKPKPPSPPVSPRGGDGEGGAPTSPNAPTSPGSTAKKAGMSAADAKESIKLGGSLKDRMAALQGKSAFGGMAAGPPPPKPASEKPKWKPPPTVAVAPAIGDDEQTGDAPKPPVIPTPSKEKTEDEATAGQTTEGDATAQDPEEESSEKPSEEDEERERRAAIAARMARLGGARVGMAPPPILGKKPEIKRSTPSTSDAPTSTTEVVEGSAPVPVVPVQEPAADVGKASQSETSQEIPSVPEVQTTHADDVSTEKASLSQVPSSASVHESDTLSIDQSASAKSLAPTSVPLPALPRRAAPPRRRAKSPLPEARAPETEETSSTQVPTDAVAESIPVETSQVEAEAVAPNQNDEHGSDISKSEIGKAAQDATPTADVSASDAVAESIPTEVSQVKVEETEVGHGAVPENDAVTSTSSIDKPVEELTESNTDPATVENSESLEDLEPGVASQVVIDKNHDSTPSILTSETADLLDTKPSASASDLDDIGEPHLSSSVVQVPEPLPAGGDPRDFAPHLFEHAPEIKSETQTDFAAQQAVPPTVIPGLELLSDKEPETEEVHSTGETMPSSVPSVPTEAEPEEGEDEEAARHARIAARMAKMGGVNPFAASRSPPPQPPSRKASEHQPGLEADNKPNDQEVAHEEPIPIGSDLALREPATRVENVEDSGLTHATPPVASPDADEDEDENARRTRIAARLAKMGGVNPFGAPKPPSRQASQVEESHEQAKESHAEAEDTQPQVHVGREENNHTILAGDDTHSAPPLDDDEAPPHPPPRRDVEVPQLSIAQDEIIAGKDEPEDEAPPPPPARVPHQPRIASEHVVHPEEEVNDSEPEEEAPLPPPPRFAPLRYKPPPAAAEEDDWEQENDDEDDEGRQIHRSLSDVVSAIQESDPKADDDEVPPPLPSGRHGSMPQPSHQDEQEEEAEAEAEEEESEELEEPEEVYEEEVEEPPVPHRQLSDIVDAVQQRSHEDEEQDVEVAPPLPAGRHGSVPVPSLPTQDIAQLPEEEESAPPPLPSGRRPSGISVPVSPPARDDSSDHEILDDEEGDPIDPRFHSPRSSTAPRFPPIVAPSPPPAPARPAITSPPMTTSPPPAVVPQTANEEENEDEEAEKARRRTIAERMAKLGGVRFGAPPPMPRASASHHEETPREEEQQPAEDEDEEARKERIRAKLAGMGGQRFGMFSPPPAAKKVEDERPAAAKAQEDVPPPPPSRPTRPPPPPQPLVEEPLEQEEELEEPQVVEAEEEAPPALPPSRRPPVPGPPKPPSRQTTADLSQSIEIVEPEHTHHASPKPPSRSVPVPPPPPQRLESQWELPEIPTSGGLMPTGDDSPTRWSEDSTSYPPAPPMKPTVSQAAPPPPSVADLNLTADDLMGIWGKVGVHVHQMAMEMQEKSKKTIIGDGSYAGFMSAVLAEIPNALPPSGQPLSYGHIVYAQQGATVQRRVADVMPGDVMVLYDAKLKGHKGLQTYNQHVGVEEPCVGVVSEVEAKKFKVRMVHANQHVSQQGVESASYRLEDLKSGQVKIFRVLEKAG